MRFVNTYALMYELINIIGPNRVTFAGEFSYREKVKSDKVKGTKSSLFTKKMRLSQNII